MEYSKYDEEWRNSSEVEVDEEEKKVDLGVGRSYECVFCKRGFNTAQALGGHMNIHRKDRSSSRVNKPKQTTPRLISSNLLGQLRRFSPPHHHQPHLTYSTYFPPASETTTHPSDPDWRMRLSLEFGPSMINVEDKELDLELRLGYH